MSATKKHIFSLILTVVKLETQPLQHNQTKTRKNENLQTMVI